MQNAFASEKVRQSLLGPIWPVFRREYKDHTDSLRNALSSHWYQKMISIRGEALSKSSAENLWHNFVREDEKPFQGGLEFLEAIHEFRPFAMWFFDAPVLAWSTSVPCFLSYQKKNTLSDIERSILEQIEKGWNVLNPEQMLEYLEKLIQQAPDGIGFAYLYQIPFLFWHRKDFATCRRQIAKARSYLTYEKLEQIDFTLTLTQAYCFALEGNTGQAVTILRRTLENSNWLTREERLEYNYHLSRFLWADLQINQAKETLDSLFIKQPAYLIRALSDPMFTEKVGDANDIWLFAQARADSLMKELMRWMRSASTPEDEFLETRHYLQFPGELYFVFAAEAARSWERERGAVELYTPPPSFITELRSIIDFSKEFPSGFSIRVGKQSVLPLTGQNSEIEFIEQEVKAGNLDETLAEHVNFLYKWIPQICRNALIEYGDRLLSLLYSASSITESSDQWGTVHVAKYKKWISEGLTQGERISSLPQETGKPLAYQVNEILKVFYQIEEEWARFRVVQNGETTLNIPSERQEIPLGGFKAITFSATKWTGDVISCIPVTWRVVSGPAVPKEEKTHLLDNWSMNLQAGVGYITVTPIEGSNIGDEGTIAVQVLNTSKTYTLSYIIT